MSAPPFPSSGDIARSVHHIQETWPQLTRGLRHAPQAYPTNEPGFGWTNACLMELLDFLECLGDLDVEQSPGGFPDFQDRCKNIEPIRPFGARHVSMKAKAVTSRLFTALILTSPA